MPLLLRIDPHDLVADVLVLADDVGEGVVDVVVRVLPGRGGGGRVPVPGRGVDVGIVHPVPLAVHDVVADLHVLEDLRHREAGGAEHPGRPVARRHQHDPRERRQAPVELDDAADVGGVAIAEVVEDLVVDLLELLAELLDLLVGEPVKRVLGSMPGRGDALASVLIGFSDQSSISTCPSGALTQVRIIWPSSPWTSPVLRSLTLPTHSLPTQVWQMPIRQPNGSLPPASSPPTRIGRRPRTRPRRR